MKISSTALLLLLLAAGISTFAQELKKKDVKKLIEARKIVSISILSPDKFIPGQSQVFDLSLYLADGHKILASDYHFIWEDVTITTLNCGAKARNELLTQGNGLLVPHDLSAYYQVDSLMLSLEIAGLKVSKVLKTDYCISNYVFTRQGSDGSRGTSGTDGYNGGAGNPGRDGSDGRDGPDMTVQIDEEIIGGKAYLILSYEGNKYRLNPGCSSVSLVSRGGDGGPGGDGGKGGDGSRKENVFTGNGGNGGRGGNGGDGGKGGTITLAGNAVEKYKPILTLLSKGGDGARGGSGGRAGNGKTNGLSGSSGRAGSTGDSGGVRTN